ncbi:precorrin-6y C5,15-methyltransferase (decarboxylating) subunit CbiE [Halanaerobiaceae bacterium Z-7014]|uniref:Precorrin-6y C5,15-methyltransferase (Decarboxylating) subunit CbiE n=1 Tax=Halonatronomonas betaini TaxID=2778430 RepID=A0A931AT75_9FIRM|nr:precorrin-6y C5,15-methyltransferase (decarboxylating) subunit CbiE [Halonatronomonas betaini]MBF8436179.1 precorrin-6y C5,15-methyltransferase (decarboxylating) subunit CbiE [Halonatronomonas betaini]
MAKVNILGIGPGSKDYLLKITEEKIKEADVLIGSKRALSLFSDLNKETMEITAQLQKIKEFIARNYQSKKIAVLVSGDPGLFSLMNYLKREFNKDIFEVIPGISSLQLAAARLQMRWDDLEIVSLHGHPISDDFINLVKDEPKIVFLTDQNSSPDQIARILIENQIKNKKAAVCEDLSYSSENITKGSLKEIAAQNYSDLNVMVIYDEDLEI